MANNTLRTRCTNPECKAWLSLMPVQAGKEVRCHKCGKMSLQPTQKPTVKQAAIRVPAWIQWITQPRPRLQTGLRWTLMFSLALHVVLWPLRPKDGLSKEQLKKLDSPYAKKIDSAKSTRFVARLLEKKITIAPPPPDPVGAIANTINTALTSDIEKVIGNFQDIDLKGITTAITANLKSEIKATAEAWEKGQLTQEEMTKRLKGFRETGQKVAVVELKKQRIEKQEVRAAMSTTEWYEKKVSKLILKNIDYDLFVRPPDSGTGRKWWWRTVYGGGRGLYLNWSQLTSIRPLEDAIMKLKNLVAGVADQNDKIKNSISKPSWPGPNQEQAKIVAKTLNRIYAGYVDKYSYHSWKNIIYGEVDELTSESGVITYARCGDGIINEFYPHRETEVRKTTEKMDELWKTALAASQDYLTKAEAGAGEGEQKEAQTVCFNAVNEICKLAETLVIKNEARWPNGTYNVVNSVVRLQMLRGPARDEMYKLWVDGLVVGLGHIIRDFARGQFVAGIIQKKEGTDDAMKQFVDEIVPLLRRDVEQIIPRKIFDVIVFSPTEYLCYKSTVTEERRYVPTDEEAKEADEVLAKLLSQKPEFKAYADKRRELNISRFKTAIESVMEEILTGAASGILLTKGLSTIADGVDQEDKTQTKLYARASAMAGRGQDLASLTADGVPDTATPLIALAHSKGHSNVDPTMTEMQPAYITRGHPETALRGSKARFPPEPAPWGLEEQVNSTRIMPKFEKPSVRFEGIPFLAKLPKLDGDLTGFGDIRPLVLQGGPKGHEIPVYAAWNYQGFLFGYKVEQPADQFYYSTRNSRKGAELIKETRIGWATSGDYFRLLFDTLDARNQNRGEPHTQEFVILPRGSNEDSELPGIERVFESQRDGKTKDYREVRPTALIFPLQPPPEQGPDGRGPYRVTKFDKDGYTVEVFIPRSVFKVPVFAPGWYIGFECEVAVGVQGRTFSGQSWAAKHKNFDENGNHPDVWGDLLMLGTDARFNIREADTTAAISQSVFPGHSYLLTVSDPDRNVHPTAEDTVIVSAEVSDGRSENSDVEIFVLKETDKNSGIFRGYINTQPGTGREVQAALEVMPGHVVRFRYVDVGNAKGERNIITELELPVVSGLLMSAGGVGK